jgi:hypothetical protein
MKNYKIYFKTNRMLNGQQCINVTFLEMDNIKKATLYAMKTFGDDFLEIIER